MSKQIFINLPVKDLQKSKAFYTSLGYSLNPEFSNDEAICIIVSESICVMLLVESFFATFIKKSICDAKTSTEVLLGLSCDSRAEVDALVAKAVAAGGSIPREVQDYGFMYYHAFEDLDGHIWEPIYMDPNAQPSK